MTSIFNRIFKYRPSEDRFDLIAKLQSVKHDMQWRNFKWVSGA